MGTPLLYAYRGLNALALPFFARHRINQIRRAGFDTVRAHEVLGHALVGRPLGPLVWIHAGSANEAGAVLTLRNAMHVQCPELQFLITTASPEDAAAIAPHLSDNIIQQFAPLEAGGPVARFLKHWRPDLGVLIGTGGGPNLVRTAKNHDLPLVRVDTRMAKGWQVAPKSTRHLFQTIDMIHCADETTAAALHGLGLRNVQKGVCISAITRPSDEAETLEQARQRRALQDRPFWSAISVRQAEEDIMIQAHKDLCEIRPNAVLLLQPEKAAQVPRILRRCGPLKTAKLRRGQTPDQNAAVLLVDPANASGMWYAAAPVCCLGGTFSKQNCDTPFAPICAGAALIHGGKANNLRGTFEKLDRAGASHPAPQATGLAQILDQLFSAPEAIEKMRRRGARIVRDQEQALIELAANTLRCAALLEETSAE